MLLNIIPMSKNYFHATFPGMGRPKGLKYHRTIAVRLEEDSGAVLERMAQEEDRPIGVMARILLKEAMEAREEKGELKKRKKPPREG